jgi:hypothetical protein
MGKSVYRWISHKCYNKRRGWYIHSVYKWKAAIRGNTNRPTLFQLQAEGEAIIHAAHTIKCKVDNNTQVVFLTDALRSLEYRFDDGLHLCEAD